ncbi:hypothetical protein [Streptomyces bauhiniae]
MTSAPAERPTASEPEDRAPAGTEKARGGLWRNRDFLKLWSGETVAAIGAQVTRLLPTGPGSGWNFTLATLTFTVYGFGLTVHNVHVAVHRGLPAAAGAGAGGGAGAVGRGVRRSAAAVHKG